MMASAPASAMAREGARGFVQFVIEHQRVEGDVSLDAASMQRAT